MPAQVSLLSRFRFFLVIMAVVLLSCGPVIEMLDAPSQKQDPPKPAVKATPTHTAQPRPAATSTTRPAATAAARPTATTAPKRVDYIPYRNDFLKRIDDLRNKYQQLNCSPTPGYPGCWEDIFGMPTAIRSYLYTDYWVNVHRSYVTLAQSLEDQLLASLEQCFAEMVEKRSRVNLDVRKGEQTACINKNVLDVYNAEWERIAGVSCRASCGEQNKIGYVEGVPRSCVCR